MTRSGDGARTTGQAADEQRQGQGCARKEWQKHRKMEEAWEALRGAVERTEETAGCVEAVEEARLAAAKHEARSEPLAVLVAVARDLVEQARAAEAERARVAAAAAAAAAEVEAAERLRLEQELAALTR
jgi:hypothetical protein